MRVGRDARPSTAASQSPLRSSRSSSLSASERERLALKQELAAWRARRESQSNPTTPTTPKPFRPSSSKGLSDEEKRALLQRRRELMRSPSKPNASPQKLQRHDRLDNGSKNSPRPTPTSPVSSSVTSSIESMDQPTRPGPRTPPRRHTTHHDVQRPTGPPPPQTPPRPPRFRANEFRAQRVRERIDLAASPELTSRQAAPLCPPLLSLLTDEPSSEGQRRLQDPRVAFPPPLRSPTEHVAPMSSPSQGSQASQAFPTTDSIEELSTSVEHSVVEAQTSIAPLLPPPILVNSPRLVNASNDHVVRSTSPLQASPRKQVRFADEQNKEHKSVIEEMERLSHEESSDEPINPLTESQSSFEREMKDQAQLMSEVDELLYQHTEEVVVTDRLTQRHTSANGREEINESVIIEQSAHTYHTDETLVGKRQLGEDAALQFNDQIDADTGHDMLTPINRQVDADRVDNSPPADNGNAQSGRDVGLLVPSPSPQAFNEGLPSSTSQSHAHRVDHYRKLFATFIILSGLLALDHLYPQTAISRGLRVARRVFIGLTIYVGSHTTVSLWRSVIHPGFKIVCDGLVASNAWLEPRAKALQSLFEKGCEGLFPHPHRSMVKSQVVEDDQGGHGPLFMRGVKSAFDFVSSGVAETILYVLSPLMHPLPTIDPEATIAAHNRLQQLAEVQVQLRERVNDLFRTQEEWALGELERMKQRRVAYATATRSILTETTKVMLAAVQEAKLSAAEHIQDFTNELAQELMISIQPELDEYRRLEADQTREQAEQDAMLKKLKLEEATRFEILRVESAKREAAANLQDEGARDRKSLMEDKVFAEVDILEAVETVQEGLQHDADGLASTVMQSVRETVASAEKLAGAAEAELEATLKATEGMIQHAEKQTVEGMLDNLVERHQELKLEHDTTVAEIERATRQEVERLQLERRAAEELARATLSAEEAVLREAEEAQRILDKQLEAGKLELEQEFANAAAVAEGVDVAEMERVVVEKEVAKELVGKQVVDEVERLVHDVEQIQTEVAEVVDVTESGLAELEEVAESTITLLAREEVHRLEAEVAAGEALLNTIALDAEQQIASTAGIQFPEGHSVMETVDVSTSSRSAIEEAERRHMLMLSVGFVILALVTAFVLYPRWRRLIANPASEAKRMSTTDRRRRRRSWQRPATVSDSEPEEVTLLQLGSSSEDGLSDTNEPEPEVVELMSAYDTPSSTFATSTRTTYSSYTRVRELTEHNEDEAAEDDQAHELATPPPTQRALRRRLR